MTTWSHHYDKDSGVWEKLPRFEIDYGDYGLKKNSFLDTSDSWTTFSSNFEVWATQNSYDCSFLVNGSTYTNHKQTTVKAKLISNAGTDAPKGYKKDWMSIIAGSNNYTFGIASATFTVDLKNHDEDEYLLITTPGLTLFTCEDGPGAVPSNEIPGIVHQLEMTYEGVK